MKNILILITITLVLSACGEEEKDCDKDNSCPYEEPEKESFLISGSVISAFTIRVDGKKYLDIEDFYSQEISRLPAKIEAAGHFGYEVALEGELGYSDLINGMQVFLAPKKNRGYAAQSEVYEDASFEFELPKEAAGDVYKLKATKRIALVLSNELEEKRFCYNFSANETSVKYDELDLPVVLDHFETSITAYDCTKDENGMIIPTADEI
jgi:hypothetical protein